MLAAMTLALAHGYPAPPFSPLFYATIATIIPVLFLAITLQGDTYKTLLRTYSAAWRRLFAAIVGAVIPAVLGGKFVWRKIVALPILIALGALAEGVALTILIAGVGGEIVALLSLLDGRNIVPPAVDFLAATALVAVIALSLLSAYYAVLFKAVILPLSRLWWFVCLSLLREKDVDPDELAALLTQLGQEDKPAPAKPAATGTPTEPGTADSV